MNHIILIGFMGSGKTSVGEKLAKRLEIPFVDTDYLIEKKMKMSVSDIFEQYGESYFRDLETETIQILAEGPERYLVSVGGGLPLKLQNQKILKEMGAIIYLQASVDILVRRLSDDTTRPVLKGGDLRRRINSLIDARGPVYQSLATFSIDTSHLTVGKIIEKIVDKLG